MGSVAFDVLRPRRKAVRRLWMWDVFLLYAGDLRGVCRTLWDVYANLVEVVWWVYCSSLACACSGGVSFLDLTPSPPFPVLFAAATILRVSLTAHGLNVGIFL